MCRYLSAFEKYLLQDCEQRDWIMQSQLCGIVYQVLGTYLPTCCKILLFELLLAFNCFYFSWFSRICARTIIKLIISDFLRGRLKIDTIPRGLLISQLKSRRRCVRKKNVVGTWFGYIKIIITSPPQPTTFALNHLLQSTILSDCIRKRFQIDRHIG